MMLDSVNTEIGELKLPNEPGFLAGEATVAPKHGSSSTTSQRLRTSDNAIYAWLGIACKCKIIYNQTNQYGM